MASLAAASMVIYMGDVVLLFHDMVYGSSVVHPV